MLHPIHSTPYCCTKNGTNTTGQRCDHELHPNGATEAYTGSTSALCEYVVPTWFSINLLCGRACTKGEWNLSKFDHHDFYFNNAVRSCSWQVRNSHKVDRKSHLIPGTGFRLTPATPSIKGKIAHLEERCGWCLYKNQHSHQRYYILHIHRVYIGMLPHKNSPSRPQKINFS